MRSHKSIKILDGPMGTELDRRGSDTSLPLWSARALLNEPELIKTIHEDFILSGSDIITTNTFRTQERTLKRAGLNIERGKELTNLAIELAKEARRSTGKCLIAGSVAPLEDCYSPDLVLRNDLLLEKEHTRMISFLAEGGVDLFLIETMNTFREAKFAYKITKEYPDIPVYVSFTCNDNGNVLGGDSWEDIISYFNNRVDKLMVNCSSLESSIKAINKIKFLNVENWGVYPNFGEVNNIKGWTSGLANSRFENFVQDVIKLGPDIIGTCCGATPTETKKLFSIINSNE